LAKGNHSKKNVLVVGAGAVGQVYGRHLQQGGANLSFYIKEKYHESCSQGLQLYNLGNKKEKERGTKFSEFSLLSSADEVAAGHWDQIWLCISATALRANWFETFSGAIGKASLVLLTPGLEDKAFVQQHVDEKQIVQGMINLISYQCPLPGYSNREPGVAYWFPPMSKSPFSGPKERATEVASALVAGGAPANLVKDANRTAIFGSSVLMPHLVALEHAGWSFGKLRKEGQLKLASQAVRQAMSVAASYRNLSRPAWRFMVRPFTMRLATRLAQRFAPFDMETYFEYHFTKTGDQTRYMIERYIETGRERGLAVDAIESLRGLIP
jgi:ketopantoate reductase